MLIKNYQNLCSKGQKDVRKVALDIAEEVINKANPSYLMREMVKIDDDCIIIDNERYDLNKYKNIYVIGAGKGSAAIVKIIDELLGQYIKKGLLVVKKGDFIEISNKNIQVIYAGHPLPDEQSLEAGDLIYEMAINAQSDDLVLLAITGGATSLVSSPPQGVSLDDLKCMYDLLLKCGGDIGEINIVRRHLDNLKGGKLLDLIQPARAVTFTLNTIPEDKKEKIIWPDLVLTDPFYFKDAIQILEDFDCWEETPNSIKKYLKSRLVDDRDESIKGFSNSVHHKIVNVGDLNRLCETAANIAASNGYHPVILSTYLEGDSREAGIILSSIAKQIKFHRTPFKPPCVLISSGELTVNVRKSNGLGGRNQEFALTFARKIGDLKNIACLAIDTDGIDGPTDVAGGIVDGETLSRIKELNLNLEQIVNSYNSYSALSSLLDTVITGQTGTNLLDFRVIVIGAE